VVGWLFQGPELRPLEMSLRLVAPFQASFLGGISWVFSRAQIVGANVGVRLPEAIELQ
jgi:hypothetical protein